MAQRIVFIDDIGEVTLAKRKGSTSIRLSINPAGKIRVGMPYWTPYSAGVAFAKSRAEWIKNHLSHHKEVLLKEGDLIGKSHRLHFQPGRSSKTVVRIKPGIILVSSDLPYFEVEVQEKARAASEKALGAEAKHLLPQRLAALAKKYDFTYSGVTVRKLISRWGSCSSKKHITLSYFLMQLPWHLIDYVLMHELLHTRHLNHSRAFWNDFEKILPNVRTLRKEIHTYKPKIKPHEN